MKTFTLAAVAAVLATAGTAAYVASPAFAQDDDGPAMRDRTETWADAQARAAAMFARLDVNKDGVLSPGDRDAKMAEMFDRIDANHDGAISREEFTAHHRAMMDHDGPEGPMASMGHGPDGGPGGMRHHGRGGPGMGGGMVMLAMADANKDGQVSRAEFDAAIKAHFDAADANKDGKVTPEERRAAMIRMRGAMRGMAPGMAPPPLPGDDD